MSGDRKKTNKLSIYLIKSEFQALEDILDEEADITEIEGVGHFATKESEVYPPSWVTTFFGASLHGKAKILSSSARGVLIIPVRHNEETVRFALAFGVGRYLMKDGVVEERFGLKVVLNSVELGSLRSIVKTALGSIPKHSREQMSRDVAASEFGIDIEQDLISSVTAKSRDVEFGKTITGKDALNLSVKVDLSNVVPLLKHCLDRYRSADYLANFDWIDQITEVRNKKLEEALHLQIVERLRRKALEKLWMAVPEEVNWADVAGFRYLRERKSDLVDDLHVETFLESLQGREITLDLLKQAPIFMISPNDDTTARWTALRCLYAEIEFEEKLYVLNNARWYEIARTFTEQVLREYRQIPQATIDLPDCAEKSEGEYNRKAAEMLDACCMDGANITHGGGHSKIEFCDLLTLGRQLVHVKRYAGSSLLSHLFSQGIVAGELFVTDADFRTKLNNALPDGYKLANPSHRPDAQEYEIVYAIISDSQQPLDIPFFSKVSLRNARRRLSGYGYKVTLKKIQRTNPEPSA